MVDNGILTPKQRKFCEEYIKTYNQTQSYATAFNTTPEKAKNMANKLMKNEDVYNYILALQKECIRESAINAEKVLQQLDAIATDPQSTRTEKLKALDLISKNLGLQTQKIEVDKAIEIKVGIEDGDKSNS